MLPLSRTATQEERKRVETRPARSVQAPVTMRLPFSPSSVSVARMQLMCWMTDCGSSDEHIEDARLVVSELVGNSVRHAEPLCDGTILICWAVERRGLKVSVTDGGSPTRPHKLNASASALAGRGVAIVEALAISWWAEQSRSRSTVHAVLSVA